MLEPWPLADPIPFTDFDSLIVFSGSGHERDLAAMLRRAGIRVEVIDTKDGGRAHDVIMFRCARQRPRVDSGTISCGESSAAISTQSSSPRRARAIRAHEEAHWAHADPAEGARGQRLPQR